MLTISLDDALAARVEAALSIAKIADANAFAVAAINDALVRLEKNRIPLNAVRRWHNTSMRSA